MYPLFFAGVYNTFLSLMSHMRINIGLPSLGSYVSMRASTLNTSNTNVRSTDAASILEMVAGHWACIISTRALKLWYTSSKIG